MEVEIFMKKKEQELLERYKEESKIDEYELHCRNYGIRILLFSLLISTIVDAVLRSINGENPIDLIFVFCGSAGVFQLYMAKKMQKNAVHFIVGIISVVAAVLAIVRYVILM